MYTMIIIMMIIVSCLSFILSFSGFNFHLWEFSKETLLTTFKAPSWFNKYSEHSGPAWQSDHIVWAHKSWSTVVYDSVISLTFHHIYKSPQRALRRSMSQHAGKFILHRAGYRKFGALSSSYHSMSPSSTHIRYCSSHHTHSSWNRWR